MKNTGYNPETPAFRLLQTKMVLSSALYLTYFAGTAGRFDFGLDAAGGVLRFYPHAKGTHRWLWLASEGWWYFTPPKSIWASLDGSQVPMAVAPADAEFCVCPPANYEELIVRLPPKLFTQQALALGLPAKPEVVVESAEPAEDPAFAAFWAAYPRKQGKGAARKSWKKLKKPAQTLKLITLALAWQRRTSQWNKCGGQYIPMPTTYLNQERWLDQEI